MKFKQVCAILGLSTLLFAGCATIVHGPTQKIGITSAPTGANVMINSKSYGKTPLFVDLDRDKEHIVSIELPGFDKSQLIINKELSGWVWGNIIFGGLIGLAIDATSGSLYNLTPQQLNAELMKNNTSVSNTQEGIIVVSVLKPDPSWEQIGKLKPIAQD